MITFKYPWRRTIVEFAIFHFALFVIEIGWYRNLNEWEAVHFVFTIFYVLATLKDVVWQMDIDPVNKKLVLVHFKRFWKHVITIEFNELRYALDEVYASKSAMRPAFWIYCGDLVKVTIAPRAGGWTLTELRAIVSELQRCEIQRRPVKK